jgi:16S rRNA (adenine1518-N6/adenine1519-N6)-dimethyltransferase
MRSERPLKSIMAEHKLAPNKKLGQNFLVNRHAVESIVRISGAGPEDVILELGVGFGALTVPLAAKVRQVIGLELDAGIVRFHRGEGDLPENVELIHEDMLKSDFRKLAKESGGSLKILANLPYSVSNPLLFKLIDNQEVMTWAVLMLQKEVADRLVAPVGSKDYSILTILLGACASVTPVLQLGPEQFYPRPAVDSTVVRLDFDPSPEKSRGLPSYDRLLLRKVVKAAFQQRRKTLVNGLASAWPGIGKERWHPLLAAAAIQPNIRAERLHLEDYVRLTNVLASALGASVQPA